MTPAIAALLALAAGGLTFGWTWLQGPHERQGIGDGGYEAFTTTSWFSGLDGLRAFSVVAVLWYHLTGEHDLALLNHGNQGVQLFFAISGFLVTTLLLRERRRTGTISLRAFYLRRTLRIFPLYYAVLAVYALLVFTTLRGTPKGAEFWQHLPAFATYTSNWFVSADGGSGHGVTFYFAWSLATEEQFYLVWPPLLLWALAAGRRAWMPALVALALLAAQAVAAGITGDHSGAATTHGLVPTAFASFAPPMLLAAGLAVLLDVRTTFPLLARPLGHRVAAPLLLVMLLLGMALDLPQLATGLVMALLVASVCLRPDTVLHPVLTLRPVAYVGTISYGVYLMHMLAANAVRRALGMHSGIDVFLCTLLVAVAMAAISHRWFETPILRLKSRRAATSREPVRNPLPGQATAS